MIRTRTLWLEFMCSSSKLVSGWGAEDERAIGRDGSALRVVHGGYQSLNPLHSCTREMRALRRRGFESRQAGGGDSVPVEVRRLITEDRDPGTGAPRDVVEDAVLAAAHVLWRAVPEALGALVDEARGKLRAEGADPGERHQDAVAPAVYAELTLEEQLRYEAWRARDAAVELKLPPPARHRGGLEITRRCWKLATLEVPHLEGV